MRLPANPEIGAEARVCIPLRARGVLLGFMFIVDAEETLGAAELAQAEEAAKEAAQILYRERRLRELERERERWLVTHLLGDDSADAEDGCSGAGGRGVPRSRTRGGARHPGGRGARALRDRRREPRSIVCGDSSRPGAGSSCAGVTTASSPIALDDASASSPRDLAESLLSLADEAVRAEAIEAVTRVGIGGAATARRRAAVVPAGARRRRRRPARRALRARRRVGRARRLPDARAVPGRPRRRRAASGAGRCSCATAPTNSWSRRSRRTWTVPVTSRPPPRRSASIAPRSTTGSSGSRRSRARA